MAKGKGNNNTSDMKNAGMTNENSEMTNMQSQNKSGKNGASNKSKGGGQNSK